MQLNAPFGKIILVCSQQLTRHMIHQVYRIPWCTSDQQPVLTSRLLLASHRERPVNWLKQHPPSSAS